MTDEERLIYNLRRAKKKVALLLQKLKKYELPELPSPRHDPELLTPEHLQAYKKIGFRNKNYVPVGVRGVFGGVVQNMHLHWKFHETVQVCCDNFPKEKIKEMATMLARLSGGIVVNVHNVKTIIMFRGRNYRQPKNLIPVNTLTKRKALFKARFEQALDSQKLNIKKMEQELRRMGVNPEDPVAMASIQRVASTFFNAIDRKDGTPYVFPGNKQSSTPEPNTQKLIQTDPTEDSDQEELDRFIAEIEEAADQEWEAEEAAEQEELNKMRYWNRFDSMGRSRSYDNEIRERQRAINYHTRENDDDGGEDHDDGDDDDEDDDDDELNLSAREKRRQDHSHVGRSNRGFGRQTEAKVREEMGEEDSASEGTFDELDNTMWESDEEEKQDLGSPNVSTYNFKSSSDEEEDYKNTVSSNDLESETDDIDYKNEVLNRKAEFKFRGEKGGKASSSENLFSDSDIAMWKSESDSGEERE